MALASVLLLTTTGPAAEVADRLAPGRSGRVLVRQADDWTRPSGVPRGAPDLFGVAVEVRAETVFDILSAAAPLVDGLDAGVDRSRSIALVGNDHVMLAGPGPAVLIYGLRRLPHLSLAEFHDYWVSTHAEFGRRALAGQGYRQVHADPKSSAELAGVLGLEQADLDGAVISETSSWDGYWERRATESARKTGAEALADEDNFIDHTRSMSMRYTSVGDAG
jgi:hypothetical protein